MVHSWSSPLVQHQYIGVRKNCRYQQFFRTSMPCWRKTCIRCAFLWRKNYGLKQFFGTSMCHCSHLPCVQWHMHALTMSIVVSFPSKIYDIHSKVSLLWQHRIYDKFKHGPPAYGCSLRPHGPEYGTINGFPPAWMDNKRPEYHLFSRSPVRCQ